MSTDLSNENNENKIDKSKVEVIVPAKSDKTIKNNVNGKDESIRKRTSLTFVPEQNALETFAIMNNSGIDCENFNEIVIAHRSCLKNQNASNLENDKIGDDDVQKVKNSFKTYNDDNKSPSKSNSMVESIEDILNSRSKSHSAKTDITSSIATIDDKEEGRLYRLNRENENDFYSKGLSYSSLPCLEDNYTLRNFLYNGVDNKDDGKPICNMDNSSSPDIDENWNRPQYLPLPLCETLQSPHEVPIGRRYAEVSQFKSSTCKRSSNSQNPSSNNNENTAQSQYLKSSLINGGGSSTTSMPANADNNPHLPFFGLDPIKGSDNNGEVMNAISAINVGETNVCFDLTKNVVKSGVSGDDNTSLEQLEASIDRVISCDAADGQFEDDMEALLPKRHNNRNSSSRGYPFFRDELSQSRTSLVSSSDGGILAEGETSSENSRDSADCPPCDLGLDERLLLTHPVWFLTSIQRSGAVHFLQGKEEGNFIVRGSSQPNTMAVSVRLPTDTGPYIEHYLIQSIEGILSLESSRFKFDSIPALIAHYAQCCDELPVQLVLPRALRETNNRQQLSSLALLGQEFWRYPMSCPKPNDSATITTTMAELNHNNDAKSLNSLTETSGLGTMIFSNHANSIQDPQLPSSRPKIFSPGLFSQAVSPSDTTSSLSSFTTSGGQHMHLMSPESVDSIIFTMSPVDVSNQRNLPIGSSGFTSDFSTCLVKGSGLTKNLSTFKSIVGQQQQSAVKPMKNNIDNCSANDGVVRSQRPQPPKTLNLDLRKPPAPPMRWAKPLSPNSPPLSTLTEHANFTVTTTVTFSMDTNSKNSQLVEVATPASAQPGSSIEQNHATFQTFAKRLSPEGECKDTLSSQVSSSNGSHFQSHSSKDSYNSQRKIVTASATTPTAFVGSGGKAKQSKARKESKHYQESDILESPQIYCQSALGDKISDYEDLWSNDPSDRTGLLSTFKPLDSKRPDLLDDTSTLNSPYTPTIRNNHDSPSTGNDNYTSDTQKLLQSSGEEALSSLSNIDLQGVKSEYLSDDHLKAGGTNEGDTTTTAQYPDSRSKQGSPFYAEPADALHQATACIVRRSQRVPLLSANHRHSEPPKGGIPGTQMCQLLLPKETEKIAGSLDELKKTQSQQQHHSKRPRGRFEQWQLDSSWEFMGNNGERDECDEDDENHQNEFDSADNLHSNQGGCVSQDKVHMGTDASNKKRPNTIHQIIAKRFPDLYLPELVRCSTPPQQQKQIERVTPTPSMKTNDPLQNIENHTSSRLSAYDNVERNLTYFNGMDSAQSDDGTVFSEPWDSSQWDTLMPHDDTIITNSDTIHLSKCRAAVSEDDTIIDELNTKETNKETLRPEKTNGRQKVATILRSPSLRDRVILCHPRNRINANGSVGPGDSLRAYTLQLSQDHSSTFARNIENFISCTKESREAAPQVVMRNMRQFMNGMKNYLVKHGEGKFLQEVESARARLKSDEFLNLDAILESVMHQLVVLPLREHLYGMFVDYYTRSEDIQLLAQNVKYACGRSAADFGIRAVVTPPSHTSLMVISNLLLRLQESELPLDKLDLYLSVISTIFDATGCPRGQQLGADDFLPVLVYVVAKCGFVGAEIEAEFMWGLLQPTLLNGEPGYYLTALCSAVHVLKNFMSSESENGTGSLDWRSPSLPACSSVLRVIIPDEYNGSLQTRTLPVRPNTTTREVCRIIAHKGRITNPQDYALFKLVDGEETLLSDVECPQDIRLSTRGKHCILAYKRIDAKIAWPTPQPQLQHKNKQTSGI